MKAKYKPQARDQRFGYLVEECGEVLVETSAYNGYAELLFAIGNTMKAVGKAQRWGLDSVNPDLPPKKQEENGDWILRELKGLKKVMKPFEEGLDLDSSLKGELKDLKRAIKLVEQDLKGNSW